MSSSDPINYRPKNFPNQRWYIHPSEPEQAKILAEKLNLSPLITQVLLNRQIVTDAEATEFLEPESLHLSDPIQDFPDLTISLEILKTAISTGEKIVICGDYDADGMTSTALLIRALRHFGADVDYDIPSRMNEGYGINQRIVEDCKAKGVSIILTVDNGISAREPIGKAKELGLKVIVTDHHDLPENLPPADAILNPKLIRPDSPYRGLAGVGVAYVLAMCLAKIFGQVSVLQNPLLELFTLGTIADLAPLTGVNRRWVKRGLKLLPTSQLTGVKALIQVCGVSENITNHNQDNSVDSQNNLVNSVNNINQKATNQKTLKPDDIGFRLGPRINAIGRLANPQIVIELLTTEDEGIALERAMQCEQINQRRQQLCADIEVEAVEWCRYRRQTHPDEKVLLVVKEGWHHGVIGIVASRLVEKFGVPVFIGTYEAEEHEGKTIHKIRGSARSIPEFNIHTALVYCHNLLGKYGGHQAAGGFSMDAENLELFRQRLQEAAEDQSIQVEDLRPLVIIDAQAELSEINLDLYQQIDRLHPCGIENKAPVFWTPNVRISEQKIVGKNHVKLTLINGATLRAIAWRWGDYFPLPSLVDIAYQLKENTWNGQTNIELELLGVRLPVPSFDNQINHHASQQLQKFTLGDRTYSCCISRQNNIAELRIKNTQGQVLAVKPRENTGLLGTSRQDAKTIDLNTPYLQQLIATASQILGVNQEFI
jgi:single-stranded-DNA-specific exonuclease